MTTVTEFDAEDAAPTMPPSDTPPGSPPRRSWRARTVERWPELALTAASLVLFGWGLSKNGWANTFYSAAARSMTTSWHNFIYGSLDPGGWITVDKPPAALWAQALSARIFGFHPWAILLPSVLAGGLSVWLLAATVRRAWGRTAGLMAGAALAITPMILAVSRSNNPDITLVLCVIVAAWAIQRGLEDGRTRWIVVAGLACGMGFVTKLLAAGLVMPGMWGAYLLCAPGRFRTRLLQCLAGAVAFFGVAVAWVGLVDMRPLSERPWIGGSTDGSASDLVFGYNGFGRLTGASDGGFQVGGGAFGGGGFGGAAGGIDQFGGPTGIGRLFNAGMGDQVMWLVPVSVMAAIVGLVAAVRKRRRDARLGSIVMWLGWAVVVYGVFAFAEGTYHNYYVSLLAPALAALVGIGVAEAIRATRPAVVLAGIAFLVTAALQVVLLRRVDAWTWLRWAVPAGVVLGVLVAVVGAVVRAAPAAVRRGALGFAMVMLAVAPTVWTVAGVRHAQSGTFPDARPTAAAAGGGAFSGFPGGIGGGAAPSGGAAPGGGGPGGFGGGGSISAREWAWLDAHRGGARWVLGVSSSMEASQPIIDGRDVVALGGFTGADNAASVTRVADLVERGELRYLSSGGGLGGFGGGGGGYASAVASACTPVPASSWGGSGTSTVSDCKGKAAAMRKAPRTTPAGGVGPEGGGGGSLPEGVKLPAGIPSGILNGIDVKKLTACLKEHGASIKAGETLNIRDPKFTKALAGCSSYLPGPGGGGGGFPGGFSGGPPGG